MKNAKIELTPQGIATFFGLVVVCLIVAQLSTFIPKHMFGYNSIKGLIPLFNFDEEKNIPTLFSTVLMLSCSLLLFMIAALQGRDGKSRRRWLGLALIFLFLSLDEFAGLHERLTEPVRDALNTSGLLFFAWVIPYALIVALMAVCYTPFLLKLPKYPRHLMFLAGILYVSGAAGMELISGWYFEQNGQTIDLIYDFMVTCEEGLEMVGLTTFQYALCMYITSVWTHVHIQLAAGTGIEPATPTGEVSVPSFIPSPGALYSEETAPAAASLVNP